MNYEFEIKRFNLYLLLLSEYQKNPSEELREDLETLKSGFIPLKYMM